MIPLLSGLIAAVIAIVAALIAMILVLFRCRGRSRTIGVLGSVFLILSACAPLISYLSPSPSPLDRIVPGGFFAVIFVQSLVHVLLMLAGVLSLTWCVISSQRTDDSPYPPAYGPTGGPSPYGQGPYGENPYGPNVN